MTATNRLAREIAAAHDREQIARGLRTWPSPVVVPYRAWLVALWNRWLVASPCSEARALLSPPAEREIWEDIVGAFARRGSPGAGDRVVSSEGQGRRFEGGNGFGPIAPATFPGTVGNAARTAMDAWSLVWEWGIRFDDRDAGEWRNTADTEAFFAWSRDFRRRQRKSGWITAAELPGFLARCLDHSEIHIVEAVEFCGFLERTPSRAALVAALERAGVQITESFPAPGRSDSDNGAPRPQNDHAAGGRNVASIARAAEMPSAASPASVAGVAESARATEATRVAEAARVTMVRPIDEEHEVRLAARWARAELERRIGEETGHAGGRIPVGIVVPDLERYRLRLERALVDTFHSEDRLDATRDARRAFNISLGPTLGDHAVVSIALGILECRPGRIPIETAGALLGSPFVRGGRCEQSPRAVVDARLRQRREPVVSARDLRILALDSASPCPELVRALDRWLEADDVKGRAAHADEPIGVDASAQDETVCDALSTDHLPIAGASPVQTPSAWALEFSSILRGLGWPGDAPMSSTVYQTVAAWQEVVTGFADLDPVTGQISRRRALGILRTMVSERQFQVEGGPAPVQVLGVFEAIGMRFDRLWFMGVDDDTWPRKSRPHPFVPVNLQRQAGVAGASPDIELQAARGIEAALVGSASDIIVSVPRRSGEFECRPCRFAAVLDEVEPDRLGELAPRYAEVLRVSAEPETLPDVLIDGSVDAFRMRQLPDDEIVFGGASVFADQAACAFRAFAVHRLNAVPIESPEPGLGPRERGELVHRALEAVWSTIRSHQELVRLSETETRNLIDASVDVAITALARRKRVLGRERFAALERRRLARLVHDWLRLERERAPFDVIGREDDDVVEVGGVRVRLRPDRVDRLEDGTLVVIDYKTGVRSPNRWFGDRPDEPQLPLYAATTSRGAVGGVYFGTLKPGHTQFRGIADRADVAPGTDVSALPLSETIAEWRSVLEALGRDFADGLARVDPKEPETCRHCALPGLCRITEPGSIAAGGSR